MLQDFHGRRSVCPTLRLAACLAVVLVLFSAAARAQNPAAPVQQQQQQGATTPNGQAVQPTVDKSQYDIFDPTPDDQMRPFSTDRPGKTHSAQTVDAGHFQLEGDFWNYAYDHWSPNDTTARAYTVVNPNLKLGITNFAELDVFLPVFNSVDVRSRPAGIPFRASGFGDFLVGGKVNVFGNDGGDQSLGAIGFVKIPTAATGLGNNMAEFYLNVPFTTALPRNFSLTLEPAVNLVRNLNKQGYGGDYQILANLSRPIIGNVVTAALEVALDFPGDHNIGPRHTLDPSLQWLVTPSIQLDMGAYVGLTKAATDWNPYVGISFRY